MKNFTPEEVKHNSTSKYVGCVISAKYARRLHEMQRDSTQYIEQKCTTESLERLCSGELNYEIINRKLTKKKTKALFTEKS